jgi:hypothetical protein
MDGVSNIAKVLKHDFSEEFVVLTGKDHLLHLFGEVWQMLEVNPIVLHA